ncbi:exotoxin [Staphylococcus aureus]|uniref:superantigen-like protein SSL4 n=1 Tax=Staphylococcus aureus TaxID=1280 RepID=UPI00091CBD75|nr:superantigen-like protein SSL4 [Staphylococcus aureus]NGL50023.1 superantigen-like protein SSL4 [Staphylococcus aureus]SGV90177.1 exotoxin [Staphylococcus aureus]
MKIRTIAKASLALGLVTTGASIVTTQSANAEVASALKTEQAIKSNIQKVTTSPSTKVKATQPTPSVTTTTQPSPNAQPQSPQSTPNPTTPPSSNVETPQPKSPTTKQAQKEINPKYKDLRSYYTKPSLEFEKQFGFMLKPWTTVRFMNVIPDWFIYKIALVGKDDKKYKDGPYDNIDVFIVLEENKYQLKKYSVGGITKTNSKKVDHKAELSITKKDEEGKISRDVSEYKITKEEISLKELDFKLRKQLIEQHNLYGNIGSGTIVIKTKNGGKYTFELHKKLQEHRMADVIDGTSIDRIEVNLTSS